MLMQVHDADNLNQLSAAIGIPAHRLYTWRDKHTPDYENTMRLLEAGGFLNFENPQPPGAQRPLEDRVAAMEGTLESVRQSILQLQRQLEPRPKRTESSTRP